MAIQPHQDRSYDSEKQLSIIVPLSLNINKNAMSYSGVEEGTTLDHNFSISDMVITQSPFSNMHFQPTTGQLILFCTQNIACIIKKHAKRWEKNYICKVRGEKGINNIAQSKINRSCRSIKSGPLIRLGGLRIEMHY